MNVEWDLLQCECMINGLSYMHDSFEYQYHQLHSNSIGIGYDETQEIPINTMKLNLNWWLIYDSVPQAYNRIVMIVFKTDFYCNCWSCVEWFGVLEIIIWNSVRKNLWFYKYPFKSECFLLRDLSSF